MATSIERISLNDSDIKLTINVWRGEPRVDIRHFENGYATKKGVSLNLQQRYHLMNAKNEIDEAKKKGFKEHIGGNVFVEMSPEGYLDVRQYFLPEGKSEVVPTRKGVWMGTRQWQQLRSLEGKVIEHFPELKDYIPCVMRTDHMNQLRFLACEECNPNAEKIWND